MENITVNIIIITIIMVMLLLVSVWVFLPRYTKHLTFINKFRLVKYGENIYCIQQQNQLGVWYFVRNVSISEDVLLKKHIIRDLEIENYDYMMYHKTAKDLIKILRENWDKIGVVVDE